MVRRSPDGILDSNWPLIVQAVSANSRVGMTVLYKQFGAGMKNFKTFASLCEQRNLSDLRVTVRGQTPKQTSIQLTEDAVEKFKQERESKGFIFLGRMSELVDKNLKTVEAQAQRIEDGDDDYVDGTLPTHLENMSKLQKLGTSIYGLEKEATVEDLQKLQLNVIMNFDPRQAKMKMAQGKTIDQE